LKYFLNFSFLFVIFSFILIVSMHKVCVGLRAEYGLIDRVVNHEFLLPFGVYLLWGVLVKEGPYGYFSN
jgi:hypothetical protein